MENVSVFLSSVFHLVRNIFFGLIFVYVGNKHKHKMQAYVAKIVSVLERKPLAKQGDVACLRHHYLAELQQGVPITDALHNLLVAWMMREPHYINKYYKTKSIASCKDMECMKYHYLPRRLIQHFKPTSVLENYDYNLTRLCRVVTLLQQLLMNPSIQKCEVVRKAAMRVKGIGTYSSEHLIRTVLVINNIRHPIKSFITMGSANDSELKKFGIYNMDQFNKLSSSFVDAGELAYVLCMMH